MFSINRSVALIKMKDKDIETVQETKIHMLAMDFTCWTKRRQWECTQHHRDKMGHKHSHAGQGPRGENN